MYLVDTNVWLERLLEQERTEDVGNFLNNVSGEHLYITDFTLHSIGVVLHRLNKIDALLKFVEDVFVDGGVTLVHLKPEDTGRLIAIITQFNLDFDDAYQYLAAEKYELRLVSFDGDFDRTGLGRKTPAEVTGN